MHSLIFSDEEEVDGQRDFNNTEFLVVFLASEQELEVVVTDSLIFDDNINDINPEGFVIVLQIEQSDPADSVTLIENRAALVFYIFDDDGMYAINKFSCCLKYIPLTDIFSTSVRNKKGGL